MCANIVMNMKNIYWRTFLPCRYFVVITGKMSVNASITSCTSNKNPFTHFSPNVKLNKGTIAKHKINCQKENRSDAIFQELEKLKYHFFSYLN